MCPNIEVMCIVKFQYATSAMLAVPYDYFLVSLLFLDVPITVIVPSPTFNFIFECFYLTCIAPFFLLIFVLKVFLAKTQNKVAE